jgi:hypothetical protein
MRYGTGDGDDRWSGGMLASESDRLATQAVLRQAYEEQRLTLDEFESRVGGAMAARTQDELARLTRDIPAEPAPAEQALQNLLTQQKLQAEQALPRRNRRRLLIGGIIALSLAGPLAAVLALALSSTAQPAGNPGPPLSGPAGCPAGTPPTALAIANALARDPVYVEPGASSAVTPAQAQQLRAEIGSLDSGRILVAVLTPATAGSGTGEEGALANAIMNCQADSQGATMVTTADSTYLLTSYADDNPTLQAVNTALNTSETFTAGLQDAVKQMAALDPGKS